MRYGVFLEIRFRPVAHRNGKRLVSSPSEVLTVVGNVALQPTQQELRKRLDSLVELEIFYLDDVQLQVVDGVPSVLFGRTCVTHHRNPPLLDQ